MPSLNRPARLNRSVLALFGLVLIAAGGFAVATHFGWLTLFGPDTRLVPGTARPPTWALYVAAAAGVVVALLALAWLLAQLARKPATTTWRFEREPAAGTTELAASTAVEPLLAELEAYDGVAAARGTLAGRQGSPVLTLVVTAEADADPAEIRRRLESEGLPRLRQALELDTLPTRAEFRFSTSTSSRIR
ncbi:MULTISPECIES: alkaline shock response membrane anchor protein AmaP [Prauserella salsuginis group]|uniref:Alkaline shock response membrane anchor protein AmaP n=2 Tax=Prauserella salsuginis group TaxID=2893672 RepID=A0A839XIS1_9PSEU|nr:MULTISPECIES: alkaline shock response membrane anchor protein AmaP [Prauserella salsuginis group]MBB3663170.1 hypothetical protein [Prauserella sediminis]MCR3721003.1 hypothetical protein [Prauserella flava]MCR3734916.1 hypothetical protein [Prauserella salsuginis]